jgi:hypothetical protein
MSDQVTKPFKVKDSKEVIMSKSQDKSDAKKLYRIGSVEKNEASQN